ncbi:hypothetical protein GC093_15445 [Paenibacillus sp. LMG 31456]|uniref:Uncharacterized protein n=1 Tax=Paenibacillus foliorum TaxID=2654974 RepID=A0A972GUA2_9BACL|nr:hypothetical protein [Paenibacillus foliorum]
MNLMERLALHLKLEVALQAEGFASEPGVLQKVGKRFIRVSGQFIVPHTLQEIVLLGAPPKLRGSKVSLRTTYMGSFSAVLVRAGVDFVEVLVSRQEEEEELVILIPYNHLISIERT